MLATRMAVEDASAADVFRGPLMEVTPSASVVLMHAREQQGKDLPGVYEASEAWGGAEVVFWPAHELGEFAFVPSFTASNMVPGQEVYTSIAYKRRCPLRSGDHDDLDAAGEDRTVVAGTSGSFTDYTVTLAPYDLFICWPSSPVKSQWKTIQDSRSVRR